MSSYRTSKIYGGIGSGSGSGGSSAINLQKDVNTNYSGAGFVLSFTPTFIFGIYRNGQLLTETTDYTIVGAVITFVDPFVAESFTAVYSVGITAINFNREVNTNYTGPNFVLGFTPTFIFGIYRGGQLLAETVDYTLAGATITFIDPFIAESFTAIYKY